MPKKVAFITGITGQDGSYLAEILLAKGYIVHGLVRWAASYNLGRIDHLLKNKDLILHQGDITDAFSILHALKKSRPDEVYNLAALTHVQASWEMPWYTIQTTGVGFLNVLESILVLDLDCKVYQACTSELFSGRADEAPQNEKTPKDPISPYGTAKLFAYQIGKNYREAYNMFICHGILFNHESPRRGDEFVTKKIINAAKVGDTVKLGNTQASRDWGFAPEYMEAAWMMLQQDKADDYVIATGETHTVEEFVQWVSELTGKTMKVIHDAQYERPIDVNVLRGDPSKAKAKLGWEAKTKGKDIAKKML